MSFLSSFFFRTRMDNVNLQSLDPRKQELLEARFYGSRVGNAPDKEE